MASFHFVAEHGGIELRAGEEREHDRPGAGQEFDPALVGAEDGIPPTSAPMTSWATVPTTISDRAVAMLSQIESRVATSANDTHSAASVQT